MQDNQIYLGDSLELIKQIKDNSIDLIYTDVPYLYNSGGGGSSELSKRIQKVNKELVESDIVSGFDYKILDEFVRVMKKVNIIIWFSKLQMQHIMNYFLNLDKEIYFELLVWKKTNPTPQTNNTWLPDLEYAFHFREKGVSLNDGYEIKNKGYVSPLNKADKDLYDHPTIKPLEFVENHILHTTKENDLVLDPYLGSVTTAVACKQNNRRFIGFEIDEEFYNIAKNRINGISQKEVKEKEQGVMTIYDFL